MNDNVVLHDPEGSVSDAIVSHPAQPAPYVDDNGGRWEWPGYGAWRRVGGEHLRVYRPECPSGQRMFS